MDFASLLKEARIESKLTQQDVADALGYGSPQYVSNWERGISPPPIANLPKLAKLFKLSKKIILDAWIETETIKMKKHLKL